MALSMNVTRFEDVGDTFCFPSLMGPMDFCLRYSLALSGMTTAGEAMASLENFGVSAGPKGDDDIQLEEGSRDTEGCCLVVLASVVGGIERGERAYSWGDDETGWTGNDVGREWL